MLQRLLLFLLISVWTLGNAFATKVTGTITQEKGESLGFATIYSPTAKRGTTANIDGKYTIDLPQGEHDLLFRFVGYVAKKERVSVGSQELRLDVVLKAEALSTREVVVNAIDPAIPIMKQVIAAKPRYLRQLQGYSCEAYVKGQIKMFQSPKKILGKPVAIPGLDSNGKGILYLSESQSDFYFSQPDKTKEIIKASKVSGRPNGITINDYKSMRADYYQERVRFSNMMPRGAISPIANNALNIYKFYYQDSLIENGIKIHKILVEPRDIYQPVMAGVLYIQDKTWRIHASQMQLLRKSGLELDTLDHYQIFVPVNDTLWMPATSVAKFRFKVFGFKAGGAFTASVGKYQVNPSLKPDFFDAEELAVLDSANKKDSTFWSAARPIELTMEEVLDYRKKDSLRVLTESKPYMDSLDKINNKPGPLSLLTGYTYRNSFKGYALSFATLDNVQYTTIEGYAITPSIRYSKRDKETLKSFSWDNTLRYGFSSRTLFGSTQLNRLYDPKNLRAFAITVGSELEQFNNSDPIKASINTLYTLLGKQNYAKFYRNNFIGLGWSGEVKNGIIVNASISGGNRMPLYNLGNEYAFIKYENRQFTSNDPSQVTALPQNQDLHNFLGTNISLTWRPRQTYSTYPNFRARDNENRPALTIGYRKAIPIGGVHPWADFDFVRLNYRQEFNGWRLGNTILLAEGSFQLRGSFIPLASFNHATGNLTLIHHQREAAFALLPYYHYSTSGHMGQFHIIHNFQGALFKNIPLLRNTNIDELLSIRHLMVQGPTLISDNNDTKQYTEIQAGIGKLFMLFDVYYNWSFGGPADFPKQGITIAVPF